MKQEVKILLAEDDKVNQTLFKKYLEKLGLTADYADNGEEAVAAYVTGQHSLIFMDMRMPVMDGLRATAAIRNIEKITGSAYIIGLSSNTADQDIKNCIDAGMNEYIIKPINKSIILEIIDKYFKP